MPAEPDSRRAYAAAIDEILWRTWDPIGIRDMPEARDEYAGYVAGVQQLLERAAPDDEIVAHLMRIETERMGLSPSPLHRLRSVVQALRSIEVQVPRGHLPLA